MKLLIHFPTRSRPRKAIDVAKMYAVKSSGIHDIILRFAVDSNDPTATEAFIKECKTIDAECKSGSFRSEVIVGEHRNKVEAVNDIPADGWDICLVASDDMIPQVYGYDDVICSEMKRRYPDLDGSLWFNDGYAGKKLNTIICVGHKYYKRFNYLYHPGYESVWCDNEFTEVGKLLGRQTYLDNVIIKHEHPANTNVPTDELYQRNDEPWRRDLARCERRRAKRFSLPILDILICTISERKAVFDRVYNNISEQIKKGGYEANVRIIFDGEEKISIGAKRNKLVAASSAEYLCFVDDDDNVSPEYVAVLVAAIGKCDVDAVGMFGSILISPNNWKKFEHDLRHKEYTTNQNDGTIYYRPPNHLNPIRRSIVVRYPFIDESHGEDSDYALRICKDRAIGSCRMATENSIYYYIPSKFQKHKHSEVVSTEGAAAPESTGPKPALPQNMKTSVWRGEGKRRKRVK